MPAPVLVNPERPGALTSCARVGERGWPARSVQTAWDGGGCRGRLVAVHGGGGEVRLSQMIADDRANLWW